MVEPLADICNVPLKGPPVIQPDRITNADADADAERSTASTRRTVRRLELLTAAAEDVFRAFAARVLPVDASAAALYGGIVRE